MKDRVMIVTGASSGIGLALSREALNQGMRVVLASRNLKAMQEGVRDFSSDSYLLVPTDVSVEADCKALVDQTLEAFGQLDVLVNNAGISMRALFSQTELTVLEKLMQVNFWGTVYCTKHALPHLVQTGGSVVGVSSIAGYKGLPARSGYSASKFAMQGFLECVRTENLRNNLHVMIACPGFTASNIRKTALAADGSMQGESPRAEDRMMTAQEVAIHILRGLKRKRRTLILTRQGKLTVWLNKFFPAFTDKLVYRHMAAEPDSPFS